ncbi:MAG: hypothetical protein ACOC44_11075 [Promethearchaeia archaeon]
MSVEKQDLEKIYKKYIEESTENFGIICLNLIIHQCTLEDLQKFAEKHQITLHFKPESKWDYFKEFAYHSHIKLKRDRTLRKEYLNSLNYLGYMLIDDEKIRHYVESLDFFAKQELIDAFSDFCADLGISVYGLPEENEYDLDLYLIRRTPLLRTESTIVRTGAELSEEAYERSLEILENAAEIGTWLVYVTTPLGVARIGFDKIIEDMENLNAWLYVIQPYHKRILGITKGGKMKEYDTDIRDSFIERLPSEPIRAPSKVIEISKYQFDEGDSYKTKNFQMFEIVSEEQCDNLMGNVAVEPKYRSIFRNFLLINQENGIPIISYSSPLEEIDDVLISGFLTAMDNFVSEVGGATALEEINYKGFFVQAAYGELVKVALFLNESADQILKERIDYFIKYFERKYREQIKRFNNTGNTSVFNNDRIIRDAKRILLI